MKWLRLGRHIISDVNGLDPLSLPSQQSIWCMDAYASGQLLDEMTSDHDIWHACSS